MRMLYAALLCASLRFVSVPVAACCSAADANVDGEPTRRCEWVDDRRVAQCGSSASATRRPKKKNEKNEQKKTFLALASAAPQPAMQFEVNRSRMIGFSCESMLPVMAASFPLSIRSLRFTFSSRSGSLINSSVSQRRLDVQCGAVQCAVECSRVQWSAAGRLPTAAARGRSPPAAHRPSLLASPRPRRVACDQSHRPPPLHMCSAVQPASNCNNR